ILEAARYGARTAGQPGREIANIGPRFAGEIHALREVAEPFERRGNPARSLCHRGAAALPFRVPEKKNLSLVFVEEAGKEHRTANRVPAVVSTRFREWNLRCHALVQPRVRIP